MPHTRADSPTPPPPGDAPERASSRRVGLASLGVAFLASIPGWFIGFSSDDLSHRLLLEGALPGYRVGWLGLYDFTSPSMPTPTLIERGLLPWFTQPELSLRFLRPISSFTLALDNALFGRNALCAHLHSALWMLGLAWVAGEIYRRWLSGRAAVLAAVLFAMSPVFGIPLCWLASRHTLVAATFGALSLWAWLRADEAPRDGASVDAGGHGAAWRALSLGCLAASLLSSESGLVTIALLGSREIAATGLRRGLVRSALPIGVGLTYLVAYAALGYGTRGSAFYVSPFETPLAYLEGAALGVPALASELLLGLPSVAGGIGGRPVLLVLGALGLLATVGAWFWQRALGSLIAPRERRALAGSCAGAALGLVALTGAPVSGRVLPLPALATAALAAVLLERTWRLLRRKPASAIEPVAAGAGGPRGRWRWRIALSLGVLFQLVIAPFMRLALPAQFAANVETQKKLALDADVGACARGGSLYLVNGSDPTLTLYAPAALLFYTPEKAGAERFRVLSMAPAQQKLTRTAPDTLLLEVLGSERPTTPFEELFRGPGSPLATGQQVTLPEVTVTVEATSGPLFTRTSFRQPSNFEHTCLLVWRNGRLENEPVPALGSSLVVQHQAGPMGL
jgi:hypothetical protein